MFFTCLFIHSFILLPFIFECILPVLCWDWVMINKALSPFLFSWNCVHSLCSTDSNCNSLIICAIISNIHLFQQSVAMEVGYQGYDSPWCNMSPTLGHACWINVRRVFSSQLSNQKKSFQLTYSDRDLGEHFLKPVQSWPTVFFQSLGLCAFMHLCLQEMKLKNNIVSPTFCWGQSCGAQSQELRLMHYLLFGMIAVTILFHWSEIWKIPWKTSCFPSCPRK